MSYTKCFYHIVFRTYRSQRTIAEQHETDLYRYIYVYCKNYGTKLWRINSMPDHIHMLVSMPPSVSIASFVKNVKQTGGNYMRAHVEEFPKFRGWADGYCCITYSKAEVDAVIRYIKNQKEHHTKRSLADEIRDIFRENDIDIDETFFKKDWVE